MTKIITVISLLLSCLIVGCASLPHAPAVPIVDTRHTIYLVYRKWHTSIVLDAQQLAVQSPKLAADLHGQKFARIGWGDGDYFTGKSKSWGTAAKALVASDYSALQLLTYDDDLSEIPAETIVPLAINDKGMHELTGYVNASIAVDEHNFVLRLPAPSEDTGLFFRATESYSLFNNCNTWSGQALRAAGLPIANRLTAQGLFAQAKEISRIQRQAGLFR